MTADFCQETMGFLVSSDEKGAFADTGPAEIVGFLTRGGARAHVPSRGQRCSWRGGAAGNRVRFVHHQGKPDWEPCPHYSDMRDCVKNATGPEVSIIEWTH